MLPTYELSFYYKMLFSCARVAHTLFVDLFTLCGTFRSEQRIFVARILVPRKGTPPTWDVVFPCDYIVRGVEDVEQIVARQVPLAFEFSGVAPAHHVGTHALFPAKEVPGTWVDKPRAADRENYKEGAVSFLGEVVLDVDLSDDIYNRAGLCACSGKPMCCDVCWNTFVRPAILVVRHLLVEEFGVRGFFFVFSGRRGVHCWLVDPRVVLWTRTQRATFIATLANLFSQDTPLVDGVCAILEPLYRQSAFLMQRSLPTRETILSVLYPKFDVPVTRDGTHNKKLPLMIHPSTQLLCAPFEGDFVPSRDAVPLPRVTRETLEAGAEIIARALREGRANK